MKTKPHTFYCAFFNALAKNAPIYEMLEITKKSIIKILTTKTFNFTFKKS